MLLGPLLALALAAPAPAVASMPASEAALPATEPAKLPLTVQFDLASKITGRTYRIYVSKPVVAPPKTGFPVLYVLDADMAFPTAAGQVLLGSLGGRPPALVVGIGYPNTMATMVLRGRDMTPSKPDAVSLAIVTGGKPDDFGGADDFHRFMMEELRPLIARMNKADPADQSLMGYSLGGLFTLHVLFNHPDAYRTYVVGSPSIWWNGREVLKDEAAFEDKVSAGKVAPRILITSDEWEQSESSPDVHASGEARAKDLKEMNAAQMVDNARALATRLNAVKSGPGYEVRYVLFPQETHQTGIPASTSRGVAFVIGK
jgi:predicted alpha/beta superfamily hydrolase